VAFDAQCDLAAVVYGADDDPDRLFIDFADDLSRSGRRVVGLVQVGRSCQSEHPTLGATVLAGRRRGAPGGAVPAPRYRMSAGYRGTSRCGEKGCHGDCGRFRPRHHQSLRPLGIRGPGIDRSHHPCPRRGYSGPTCCSRASLRSLYQVLGRYECPVGVQTRSTRALVAITYGIDNAR